MADWLDSTEFNALLLAYRMAPGWHQPNLNAIVERLVSAIRVHADHIHHVPHHADITKD